MTMEKWICCGHDIIELCSRAGCQLPALCFFCGEPRKTVTLSPLPEDWLAFELAELWSGKIREFHGDPETHVPSLDQYGRTDVEAWRAVARRVLDLISSPSMVKVPDSQSTRDALVKAIQSYAEEWAGGRSTVHSEAKVALCIAMDRHEFEMWDQSRFDLASVIRNANCDKLPGSHGKPGRMKEAIAARSCGSLDAVFSTAQEKERLSRSSLYGKTTDIKKE